MRIKDLATRATKLLTGNAWFVVDNGTKVEKAAFSEVVKQGIEEYAGSTLAGSAQSVKAALDALNSNKYGLSYSGMVSLNNNDDLNNYTTPGSFYSAGSSMTATLSHCPFNNSGFSLHIETVAGGSGQYIIQTIKRISDIADIWTRTYNGSTWTDWEQKPYRSEITALNSKTAHVFIYEISTDAGNSNWKLEAQSGYSFPTVLIFGANGSIINQTIQILGSGVDSIFQGDNSKNLLPVKISNAAFSITVWEYARLCVISRAPLTITKITS